MEQSRVGNLYEVQLRLLKNLWSQVNETITYSHGDPMHRSIISRKGAELNSIGINKWISHTTYSAFTMADWRQYSEYPGQSQSPYC